MGVSSLQDLYKRYAGGKVAVDGVSFGIPAGQCFGFLVSGASDVSCTSLGRAGAVVTLRAVLFDCVCTCMDLDAGNQWRGQNDDTQGAVRGLGADDRHRHHRRL